MSGFITHATGKDRDTYILNDINSSDSIIFCSKVQQDLSVEKTGNFYISNDAIIFGNNILQTNHTDNTLIIIDEVGPFEISGNGWNDSLQYLLQETNNTILIVVRKSLVDKIITGYNLKNAVSYHVTEPDSKIVDYILNII